MDIKNLIAEGKCALGIEFGSTRIKAVLVDTEGNPVASGGQEWENSLVDGIWTYSEEEIWGGLQECYADLKKNVKAEFDVTIKSLRCLSFLAIIIGL